jgi:hypothetical protein
MRAITPIITPMTEIIVMMDMKVCLRLALRYLVLSKNSKNMKTPANKVAFSYERYLTFCDQKMNPIRMRGLVQQSAGTV